MKNTEILKKLERIAKKYKAIEPTGSNYNVGGGMSEVQYVSRRHEDAKLDPSKKTLGQTKQIFKRATGLPLNEIEEIIRYAVPNMEWHHAGFLPKQYGGGMRKTYFLNSAEIADIAENFFDYKKKLELQKETARTKAEKERIRQQKRLDFLETHATRVERVSVPPKFFYETDREMHGKYGWFSSYEKSYNLPEYYSGWKFENEKDYNEFLKI